MTQRKIPHLLKDEGNGRDHRYLRELRVPIDLREMVLVTDKVDGTTVQGIVGPDGFEVHKRFDNFRAGDPAKHAASELERYRLERLRRDDPAARWIWAAVDPFMDRLARLPSGLWTFFEALGASINARYKNPPLAPTIRVFDTGRDGEFAMFADTYQLANSFGLPVVDHRLQRFGDLETLVSFLVTQRGSPDHELGGYPIEGWVLRQDSLFIHETVAKIRVKDLDKLAPA